MAINSSRNLNPVGLGGDAFDVEEGSPSEGLTNLADAMLVFACGLIVALVAHYGVQLGATSVQNQEMQELNMGVEQAQDVEAGRAGNYDEVGTVYRDAATGKLYVVTPDGSNLEGE